MMDPELTLMTLRMWKERAEATGVPLVKQAEVDRALTILEDLVKARREWLDEGEIAAGDPAAVQEWLEQSYTCPKCGKVSHHPEDLQHRYCAACHEFERG